MRTNGMAVVQMLDSILRYRDKNAREIRFFQASTAEIFGSDVAGHSTRTRRIARARRTPLPRARPTMR